MPIDVAKLPPAFVKQAKKLEDEGGALTTTKMVALLGKLEGKSPEIAAAGAAWLLEKGQFGAFTIAPAIQSTLKSFITDNGGSLAAATSPMSTRLGTGTAPKLSDAVKTGIDRGTQLAVQRDEVSWKTLRTPPSSDDFFTPPAKVKLDAGDGAKQYLVYVSKRVGIDMDTRKVTNLDKAEQFMLFDQTSGKYSSSMNLSKPMGGGIPGAGTSQPGLDMPTLGAKLPSVVANAIDTALDRAIRTDDARWRTSNQPPSTRDHFAPPYKMKVEGPDGSRIDVMVYFSKTPSPTFAAPPTKAEESKRATLYDLVGKNIITDVTFSMPGRVTLPVIGGGD